MQMHNGTRTGEGSFNVALKDLFYKADISNKRKLVEAFPNFFGDEVPEFGIHKLRFAGMPKVTLDNCISKLEDSIVSATSIIENLPEDDFAVQNFIETIDYESSMLQYLRKYKEASLLTQNSHLKTS